MLPRSRFTVVKSEQWLGWQSECLRICSGIFQAGHFFESMVEWEAECRQMMLVTALLNEQSSDNDSRTIIVIYRYRLIKNEKNGH
jgi:hypothetical protein